jgi:hypothetical protein
MSLSLRALPFTLMMIYLLSTILLFWFGPLDWPTPNPKTMALFLTCAVFGICAFYVVGAQDEPEGRPISSWRSIIVAGAILSVVILFPSAHYYADKMPWQILDALKDQKAAYDALQKKLVDTAGTRTLISAVRAMVYPVIFAALPLSILNWRRMSWWLWILTAAAVCSGLIFSILRGTDREGFDMIIIAGASGFVVAARSCVARNATLSDIILNRKTLAGAVLFLVIASFALSVFADRRAQRTGYTPEAFAAGTRDAPSLAEHLKSGAGWGDVMCIRDICLDPDHVLVRYVDAPKKYTILMLTSYLTQGYFGLSLAMTNRQSSTLGIGHSSVITRLYERLTHDASLYERSYTFGLRQMHWSDESQWSSIFPWLANDVGFPGSIAVICLLAFLWGRSWRDAVGANNDAAAIVFCLLFQLFVYVPANNQLAQTFDAYFTITGWCAFWLLAKLSIKKERPALLRAGPRV